MSAYFRREDLEARVSPQTVREVFDDDNTGTPSSTALARLIGDACSKVDSYLQPVYGLPLVPTWDDATDPGHLLPIYPTEVVRLALDVAVAMLAQRHPEYVKRDWERLMKAAEDDLMKLRKSTTTLDSAPPEPGANQGAHLTGGVDGAPPVQIFDDMGDW